MKNLLLSGYGIHVSVDGGKLRIQDGRDLNNQNPQRYIFKPKFIDIDNIVIYGHSGSISLDAIRWLTKQRVQLSILNWNGRLLTTILPIESRQGITRIAQYRAYENEQRIKLAKIFVEAKVRNSITVLKWLGERYPTVAKLNDKHWDEINLNWSLLQKANRIDTIMGLEGKVARPYWYIISSIFDKKFEFTARKYGKTPSPRGATDPINALFNYGYSILESYCRQAINLHNLDPYIGFLHEINPTKIPLAYDLQEPFRWLVDVAVISGLEKKLFTKKDFITTENYNIRIKSEGVKKLMTELQTQFGNRVVYQNQKWEWRYIIIQKTCELAQYLTGKRKILDFSVPQPNLKRTDTDVMRKIILNISYAKWKKMGFSKGTLYYLKKNAKSDKPFKIYKKVWRKLKKLGEIK